MELNMGIVQNGYVCGTCGCWINEGALHNCRSGLNQTFSYQCPRCSSWVFGNSHVCVPALVVGTFYPPVAATCQHCYCIDVPPSGERTKEHHKCCKCQDVQVKP